MKTLFRIALPVALIALLALAVTAWAKPGKGHKKGGSHGGKVVTVIEHATTDATTDTGATGDSAGDVLTFANQVFDSNDASMVGSDQGYCIRVVVGASYECNLTTILPKGQITVEGPFYDAKNSTLAITGGTGKYRNARGTMDLQSRDNGAKYVFVFHIIG
jgi:allene oxide cyclase-like protein